MKIWIAAFYVALGLCVGRSGSIANAQTKHCVSLVTFSGQEIQVGGQKMTVLSDAQGGIILMGNDFAWSSREPSYAKNDLKIEARNLGSTAM